MQFEEITPDDFPKWIELRQKLYSDLDPSFQQEEIALMHDSDEAAAFFCVTEDGAIAGLLEMSLRNFVDGCLGAPVGYIEGLYLEPPFRRRGLGREAIEWAADWFRTRGCSDMATDALLDNTDSQQFFRTLGFEETFRIVGFKRPLFESRPTGNTPR